MSLEIEYIEHEALVTEVDLNNNFITVRIDDPEECGECPAAKLCQSKGQPSNVVKIYVPDPQKYHKDDLITVRGTERMHRKAIMYATVFPCIILVASMVGIYLLTGNQLAAALSGIGIMLLFFFILWLSREKIAHEFIFNVVGHIERAGEMK